MTTVYCGCFVIKSVSCDDQTIMKKMCDVITVLHYPGIMWLCDVSSNYFVIKWCVIKSVSSYLTASPIPDSRGSCIIIFTWVIWKLRHTITESCGYCVIRLSLEIRCTHSVSSFAVMLHMQMNCIYWKKLQRKTAFLSSMIHRHVWWMSEKPWDSFHNNEYDHESRSVAINQIMSHCRTIPFVLPRDSLMRDAHLHAGIPSGFEMFHVHL